MYVLTDIIFQTCDNWIITHFQAPHYWQILRTALSGSVGTSRSFERISVYTVIK